ncbi:CPBP family intramembrane glutamic endopeptidase [Chryseobacterium koreense]|uniref:CAAX protease n=1 Tax=Chryseobacterium koreense CCUG 49689 TaxID=1304281 RepID=A0A0J7J1J3_9FLAO|nr:type II CAAX endopeptidase family protein [Chryseobacterium koreense]KMQ71931.1 CAAX protease [Chryseobacterium koreense CCUG 49689]MBB5334108.1 hypothetical protein [Chryseobacterium koreense]
MYETPVRKKFTFGWKGALALVAGMIAGTSIMAVANIFSMFVLKDNLQYGDFYMIATNAAGFLGAIFAFDYLIYRPQTGRKLNFNLSTMNFSTYLLIFPMMLGMMFIAEFVTAQIPVTGPFFGKYYKFFSDLMSQMTNDRPTLILLAVIMAPLFEEIVFRGIIQGGLINRGVSPLKAILLSSIIFGLVHANPWQFVGAVFLGCVLGLVYYKTKSLLMPILLHAFNNLCSALLIFYGNTESFSESLQVSEYVVLGIGIVLFSAFYFLFMKKYRIQYSKNP